MTEILSSTDSPISDPSPPVETREGLRWRKAAIAGLLSLFLPGMGQLYNRAPRKAFVAAIVTHIFGALLAHTRLLLSFWTMISSLGVLVLWQLFVAAEAAYTAAKAKKPESPLPLPWLGYPLIGLIIVIGVLAASPEHTIHESGFHVYKIPSVSMCPTICVGDRVVADAWAYRGKSPQRGDIILLKHASTEALLIKRVIGLPGDLVEPGAKGSVLVNGQPFRPPAACGNPDWGKEAVLGDASIFQTTKVPEGTFFVIGDNPDLSFDSRFAEFGSVTPDIVRGKALYFMWSSTRSRTGCTVR